MIFTMVLAAMLAGCEVETSPATASGFDTYDEFVSRVVDPTDDDCHVFRAVVADTLASQPTKFVWPVTDIRSLDHIRDKAYTLSPLWQQEAASEYNREIWRFSRLSSLRQSVDFRLCGEQEAKPFFPAWEPKLKIGSLPMDREFWIENVGILQLAPAGYSESGDQAVVYAVLNCGGLCSQGGYYWLEGSLQGWKVTKFRMTWIS
ncbi:MAG: hypothetical protein KKF36_08075 [Alphaproteobacteria bacterium]|nr:hypothetical protein [Alphaproteobacteria bacterium]